MQSYKIWKEILLSVDSQIFAIEVASFQKKSISVLFCKKLSNYFCIDLENTKLKLLT